MEEFELIQKIKRMIPAGLQGDLTIGDDADCIRLATNGRLIVTSDVIVENVDFILKTAKPESVGRKALAVNLSDMAAMGAKPIGFTIALGIPASISERWILDFYRGMLPLMKKYGVRCLGGDLSKSGTFFASVTAFGEPYGNTIALRSKARTGDWIGVTGSFGGSISGRHLTFEPRVEESQRLMELGKPNSMIDVSDGLAQDLKHILKASGKGALIDLESIPVSREAVRMAKGNHQKALQHALTDGEDFELLFTVSSAGRSKVDSLWKKRFPKTKLSWIGRIKENAYGIKWTKHEKIMNHPGFSIKGYQHFK